MEQPHPYRERIPPVAAGLPRPRWSVMIPTYNCADFLRETLQSVLVQDPGPELMQIEVVDDCSTKDDPAAVVAELGQGRVSFYRQPVNGGHTANFRTCLLRSRGYLVHLLHGDDFVRPGFYAHLQAGFDQHPALGAAFCRHTIVDAQGQWIWTSESERATSGILKAWLPRIALRQRIQTPAIVVRRDVYETLGMFDRRLAWVEDWEMWARIAANYPVWYEVEPLAVYRVHGHSNSSRHTRSGENLRDVRRAVAIISRYLPPAEGRVVARYSLEHWACDALEHRLPGILQQGDVRTALVQIGEALRCSRSPRVLRLAAQRLKGVVKVVVRQRRLRG